MILAGDPLHWPGAPDPPPAIANLAAACRESVMPLDAVLARREFLLYEGAASRREQAEAAARPRRYRLASPEAGRCLHCGSPMPAAPRRRGRQPVTCSPECSAARKRDRDAARRRDERAREANVPHAPGDGYGSVRVAAGADDVEAGLYEAGGFTVYRPRAG